MRIIDEATQSEIENPDLEAGELYVQRWVDPAAYEQAIADGLDAVPDDAWEDVYVYRAFTPEEVQAEHDATDAEVRDRMLDAVAAACVETFEQHEGVTYRVITLGTIELLREAVSD